MSLQKKSFWRVHQFLTLSSVVKFTSNSTSESMKMIKFKFEVGPHKLDTAKYCDMTYHQGGGEITEYSGSQGCASCYLDRVGRSFQ